MWNFCKGMQPSRTRHASVRRTLRDTVTLAVTLLFFLTPFDVRGQEFVFQRSIDLFSVFGPDNRELKFPFFGGFNAPRPQFIDIDDDGDLDLFVQEDNKTPSRTGRVAFFENIGSPLQHDYRWRTDNYLNLDIGDWYKFVDFDADGDFDLLAESGFTRIRYYRNTGSARVAQFEEEVGTLFDVDNSLVFFDAGSSPELADVDCDGDFDLFIGRAAAGTITLYENVGLGPEGLPQFAFVTDNFENISIIGESVGRAGDQGPDQPSTHGSNTLSVLDIDNDMDPDIFWGDRFEPSVVFLRNSGNCAEPDISITTRQFPFGNPLLSRGFNMARFADIDADGVLDMFVGILGETFSASGELGENFYFYQNKGSVAEPQFELRERQFLSNLDVGTNSVPALADLDGDGDLDLLIGNEVSSNDRFRANLTYFTNAGTMSAPMLLMENEDFLQLDVGFFYSPVFTDIDGDGDEDLFIGLGDGKLALAENMSTGQTLSFGPVQANFRATIAGRDSVIDVGNNCKPTFVDIDADGDEDLFMGEFFGNVNYYQNRGLATEPAFELVTDRFENIAVGTYSYPSFVDIDHDGDFDLFVGSESNGMQFYRNRGSPEEHMFFPEAGPDLELFDRATPIFADPDGDSDFDIVAGTNRGGLLLFENRRIVTSVEAPSEPVLPVKFELLQNVPNPFNPETNITYVLREHSAVRLTIFNLGGREIATLVRATQAAGTYRISWDGTDDSGSPVSSGIYFYQIQAGHQTAARTMLLLK